ncbi:MAG TPA: tyrosine-type recombinase/integrase [Acidobacteriaceae bacterium]|nr:tyrosine-type recombinase/integrase [Acidobacteriaceae bacterium]
MAWRLNSTLIASIHAGFDAEIYCPKVTNVQRRATLLCGLARPDRQAEAEIVPKPNGSTSVRGGAKGESPPKSEKRESIGDALSHWIGSSNVALDWAARTIVTLYGSITPTTLAPRHIPALNAAAERTASANTRQVRSTSLRRCLFYLADNYGAKANLGSQIARHPRPRPRNITATSEEREAIIRNAPDHVRVWILLCSDLGIRSGTAAKITPNHYDKARRELTFTTKYEEKVTLPVTSELAALLSTPGLDATRAYTAQLSTTPWVTGARYGRQQMTAGGLRNCFKRITKEVGITRRLVPHDLRRTTAVRVYENCHDLRKVQSILGHTKLESTLWYLDHRLTPVSLSDLELAKLNPTTEAIQ